MFTIVCIICYLLSYIPSIFVFNSSSALFLSILLLTSNIFFPGCSKEVLHVFILNHTSLPTSSFLYIQSLYSLFFFKYFSSCYSYLCQFFFKISLSYSYIFDYLIYFYLSICISVNILGFLIPCVSYYVLLQYMFLNK